MTYRPIVLALLLTISLSPGLAWSAFQVRETAKTLSMKETLDDGDVTVEVRADGSIDLTDSLGTTSFAPRENLKVQLLDNTREQLTINLQSVLAGSLTVLAGNGRRTIELGGGVNEVAGNLMIKTGKDSQILRVSVAAPLSVAGNVRIDLGSGSDEVQDGARGFEVGKNLTMMGVNAFRNYGSVHVTGNVKFAVNRERVKSVFDNESDFVVERNFAYIGSSQDDDVFINDDMLIGGNVIAKLFDGPADSAGGQNLLCNPCTIGGNLKVSSGDTSAGGDRVVVSSASSVGKSIVLRLGEGPNRALLAGAADGGRVKYQGGSGVDELEFDLGGSAAALNAGLGDGADHLMLGASASLRSLKVDFGDGTDVFTNELAVLPDKTTLRNLP